jgi:UDP-N-acetylmuramoylalanine--D-glutamate ligase
MSNIRKIGILGLGISGQSLVKFLEKGKLDYIYWDDKKETEAFTPLDSPKWEEITDLIVSPGINNDHPLITRLVKRKINIYSDIELFYQIYGCKDKIIAITGTNGKSTTTALIHHIVSEAGFKSAIGGNFGIGIFDLEPDNYDYLILELSSFQLDRTEKFHPRVGVLINISKDHIDYHGTMEKYISAKEKIFYNQDENDLAIIGVDSQYRIKYKPSNLLEVSQKENLENGICIKNNKIIDNFFSSRREEIDIPDNISLKGVHNLENILCAYSACREIGITSEQIMMAVASYKGLAHRMEYIGERNGVVYVNDSKATNFDSAKYALTAFNNIHWIIGGIEKEGGIEGFAEYLSHIKSVYLIGSAQDKFSSSIGDKIPEKYLCGNLKNAFDLATSKAQNGDVILLSPACASMDQWQNYAARGDAFRQYFEELGKK